MLLFSTEEGAVRGMCFRGGLRLVDLHVDPFLPRGRSREVRVVQAAGPGRVLLALGREGAMKGFVSAAVPGSASPGPPERFFTFSPDMNEALTLAADPGGTRVAAVLSGRNGSRALVVFQSNPSSGSWKPVLRLEDVGSLHIAWSGRGRYLLFGTRQGSVELYDFSKGERRWLRDVPPAFSDDPCFQGVFDGSGNRLFLVVPDDQGYLQITSVEIVSGKEYFFTSGWADHYGPALSPDGRYITYRQADLQVRRSAPDDGEEGGVQEDVYLWDFRKKRVFLLGTRTISFRTRNAGPCFSGDGRCVCCVMDGAVFQYPVGESAPEAVK